MTSSSSSSSSSLVPLALSLQFKNGSLSKPTKQNNENNSELQQLNTGEGEFVWSSGLKYTGGFSGNKRHGYGVQLWPDGARYEGLFHQDQRQGAGRHCWGNGEEYEGEYRGDRKHGAGVYRWPSGAFISGSFNQDSKEGHCVYVSADGERFEGMYRGDVRDGEGVLTYPGGRQDVGWWRGNKLVKLKFTVREAKFDPCSCEQPLLTPDSSLGSPEVKERGKYGPKGFLEVASEELIQAAAIGDMSKLSGLLKSGAVYVDVADRNGHTSLFAAAVHSQCEAIHTLLDHGADINRLDSLGITALNACYHILYSTLPQVKAVLKALPPLEYPQANLSPPHSVQLSDCSLHTSDFLSSPHLSIPTPHPTPSSRNQPSVACVECQGFCGRHSPQKTSLAVTKESLTRVSSLPLVTIDGAEKRVQFVSLNDLSKDLVESEARNQEFNEVGDQLELATNLHQALIPFVENPIPEPSPESRNSKPISPIPDSNPSRLTGSQQSYTASMGGDILGVSTLSPDFYSSSNPRLRNEPPSRASLPHSTPDESTPLNQFTLEDPLTFDPKSEDPLTFDPKPMASLAPFHSSSVFSSSQYGPIVSAAQSTTLSCGSESLGNSSSLSTIPESTESIVALPATESTINLLLRRGACPDHSSLPLPPLLYAIRSGDASALQRLIERGADVNKPLPVEIGGHPPLTEALSLVGPNPLSVIDCLLQHGARVSLNQLDSISSASSDLSSVNDVEEVLADEQCTGEATPLHTACSHRDENPAQRDKLSETVYSMVELLLAAGCSVDAVSCGHSPLSLAIINGHDKVVETLLNAGCDPNLALGAAVGNALCALTTHAALKVRDQEDTLKLLGLLLKHGANFSLPVHFTLNQPSGTLADFAHAAFKEDKRLFHLKYHSLTKPERARHRAWHKLQQTIVHLFRAKALQAIAMKERDWLQAQLEQHMDNRLQVKRDKMLRASSAMIAKSNARATSKRARNTRSAGGVPSKTKCEILPSFPLHTMKSSLTKLTNLYGPSLNGLDCTDSLGEVDLGRGQEKRLRELKQLFDSAIAMFQTEENDQINDNADSKINITESRVNFTDSSDPWTLSCFCYECGRSAGVHLVTCPGCQYVYYCSHTCRMEGFKKGHQDECSGGFNSHPGSTTKKHH